MANIEIVEANLIVFVDKIEKAINDGYKVDYEVYPRNTGYLYTCNLIKDEDVKEEVKTTSRKPKATS
jgi:hypothetical protein